MRPFFSHIWWFPYFFLTFYDSILTLCSSNITCDSSFLTLCCSLTFFLTFDGSIPTLCNFNITYNGSFVTLGGSLTFFSHLTVPSSHCTVPTSHVTVLFSHLVVPLLFSHIWWFPYFFLTFDGSILTLCSSNITCDNSFLTFGGSFTLFFHI